MITLHQGDCRDVLATLPAESVHCCVTSPPYFGLRDYGTAQWDGGDAACAHVAFRKPPTVGSSSTFGYPADGGPRRIGPGNNYHEAYTNQFRQECGHCGAIRIDRQIGLEPTPDVYVATLVEVFRQVRRVLRQDGTVWLNLGDTYAGSGMTGGTNSKEGSNGRLARMFSRPPTSGIKPKDLLGIPWRVAFALQADGWYLRSDIIWAKPNPMPESVTDRPTKAHEYLFLLAKSERYYYDAAAISEKAISPLGRGITETSQKYGDEINIARPHSGWMGGDGESRNRRSVWTVATQPYSEAHFATFPPALIEPCILAGCPPGGTVLDPFGGAGTTGLVADRLQRNAVLIELNQNYTAMGQNRIIGDAPLFVNCTIEERTNG